MISLFTHGVIQESGFNPRYIPNTTLWYDAADTNTMFDSISGGNKVVSGGSVVRWEDKSGENNHATQSIANNQPKYLANQKNGLGVVSFDGANDFMRTHAPELLRNKTGGTALVVHNGKLKSTPNNLITINNSGTSQRFQLQNTNNAATNLLNRRLDSDGLFIPRYSNSKSGSNYDLVVASVNYSGATSYMYVNGCESILSGSAAPVSYSGSTSDTTSSWTNIGCNATGLSGYFSGSICELMFYDRVLNSVERRSLENYLSAKWGLDIYKQSSPDIFSGIELYIDAANTFSYPGSGSTWYDMSGNDRHGIMVDCRLDDVDNIKSIYLNGSSSYVNFGNILNYTSESFSFSFWQYLESGSSSTGTDPGARIINKGEFLSNGYYFAVQGGELFTFFGSNQTGVAQFQFTNNGATGLGKWCNVTITRQDSIVKIYCNGTLASTTPGFINNPQSNTDNLYIGSHGNGDPWPAFFHMRGKMASWVVYSRVLTDKEALEIYNFGKTRYGIID